MKKIKIVYDIASCGGTTMMVGITRVCIEVLRRLAACDDLEITLICSQENEEQSLRNFRKFCAIDLPFQSKDVEHYVLSTTPTQPYRSPLRRLENAVRGRFPGNRMVNLLIEAVRRVKWAIKPPPPIPPGRSSRPPSPFLDRLLANSDVYFSVFYPFVFEADRYPHLRRHLFIHDIIPILFPEHTSKFFLDVFFRSLSHAIRIYANSDWTKKDLLQYFPNITSDQVLVVPLAAGEKFVPCHDAKQIDAVLRKYAIPVDKPYILSVASLDLRKNIDHVIRSFETLTRNNVARITDAQLVLVGGKGWAGEKIDKAYADLPDDIKSRVLLTGHADDDDLPLLYAGARCFCYMSLYEGFGLPPLEAMSCGTPTIAANTSSLPEVVGDAGILLDPQDRDGLADAFFHLLTDDAWRATLAEKGQERSRLFSWDRCVDAMLCEIRTPTLAQEALC